MERLSAGAPPKGGPAFPGRTGNIGLTPHQTPSFWSDWHASGLGYRSRNSSMQNVAICLLDHRGRKLCAAAISVGSRRGTFRYGNTTPTGFWRSNRLIPRAGRASSSRVCRSKRTFRSTFFPVSSSSRGMRPVNARAGRGRQFVSHDKPFPLFQSLAIIDYLDETHPKARD